MTSAKQTCTIRFEPSGLSVDVPVGTVLLEAAQKLGVYVSSICGGDGYCGKCKVVVDEGRFRSQPTTLLSSEDAGENTVLACQTRVLSDMTVTIPKSHHLDTSQILDGTDTVHFRTMPGEAARDVFVHDPLVQKIFVELAPPTVDDHTADHERLMTAVQERMHLKDAVVQMGFRVLQELPRMHESANYRVTPTVGFRGGATEIVQVELEDCSATNYAVAVDLGTTTLVAHLVDLVGGSTLDSEATYNSQINFGEDYIRRIIYAEQHDAFDDMQSRLVKDVNDLILTLAERNKVNLHDITAVACAGNTVMMHFFLHLDCRRIRREPYVATASHIPPLRAAEVGVRINKRGLLYCLPSVAAFVGGDIVAGVLTTRLHTHRGLALFVDIGTNGEVVLGNSDWMLCASSSAGPAFEGSGVRNGMRAGAGAIEKLRVLPDRTVKYETIGQAPPIGICGSGLLDGIAELSANGLIDRTGRFQVRNGVGFSHGEDGWQFTLVGPSNGRQQIVLTQADIDNLIRAKAGVFAAIRTLMDITQTQPEKLDVVYLAGGFGNYIDVARAVAIGLLPDVPLQNIHFVGNTSIAGAKTVLLSRAALDEANTIASAMTYVDLMSQPSYMDEFIRAKFLPHTDLSLFPSCRNSAGIGDRDVSGQDV